VALRADLQQRPERVITYVFRTDGTSSPATLPPHRAPRDSDGVIDSNKITFDTRFEFDEPGRLTPSPARSTATN